MLAIREFHLLILLVAGSESSRILVLSTTSTRSHAIVMEPLVMELAARGHQLTMVTCFPHSPPVPNLHEIDLSGLAHPIVSNLTVTFIEDVMPNLLKAPFSMADFARSTCERALSQEIIQKLWSSDQKFDLVITETFTADCYSIFSYKFDAPLISLVTSSALPWVADNMGLPDNPSYIPNYFSEFSSEMSLLQRLYNTVTLAYLKLVYKIHILQEAQSVIDRCLQNHDSTISEAILKTSLVFINSHYSTSLSRPFPPNVIEIGGIHILNSSKPLPQDLQMILEKSPQGVLVVSFGSLLRTASIPQETIRMFLTTFSKLPQTVIFKYEEPLDGIPPNVVIRKWLPQQQIIEHKNVQGVITHGGQASVIEAVYYGKPLVGIPFFADQYLNVKSVAAKGAAILLYLNGLTQQTLEHSINEILTNTTYRENMIRLSSQFRDRPISPLQSAVYWTEYVIRHKGAPHLRPASVDLPLYQYLLLDVIAVLMLPLFLLTYIIYFLFFKAVTISPNDAKLYKSKKNN